MLANAHINTPSHSKYARQVLDGGGGGGGEEIAQESEKYRQTESYTIRTHSQARTHT